MSKYFNNVKVDFENNEDIYKENIIYKLTFPNGKLYIGQTSRNLNKRLSEHCNNIKDKTFNNPKANAIRKYMTFKVNILYQGEDLDNQEVEFIKLYNSINREFGYNLESGGTLNKIVSEKTKRKISEANKGRIVSEESKRKISESSKGRIHSEKTKIKMSESQKGRIHSEKTKIKIGEAHKGMKHSEESKEKMRGVNNPKARSIIVIELSTGIETRFDTIKEASIYYDCNSTSIINVLTNRSKTFNKKQYKARYE